jgi:hypothetical protein
MAQVKTYRSLRDGQRVGDTIRDFGDFIPEAAEWPNLRAYLNADYVEEVVVDQELLDANLKEVAERSQKADEDVEGQGSVVPPADPGPSPKKKSVKKKTVKKTAKKKITKPITAPEQEGTENVRLAEQNV